MPNYATLNHYSAIQTFYADPEIVNGSLEIALTSIDLHFKTRPDPTKNASGKASPGVGIMICDVINDQPVVSRCYQESLTRAEYNSIVPTADSSSPTTFRFSSPLKLKTGQFYGIVVIFDDPGFVLWENKQGDKIVGTNTPSAGSNLAKDGKMYAFNNSGIFTPLSDRDLKFTIKVAKYTANSITGVFTNREFEFLTITNRSGDFIGGEDVYKTVANAAGAVGFNAGAKHIWGSGTNFTSLNVGTKIGLYGNTTQTQIFTVDEIANSTSMTVAEVIPFTNASSTYFIPAAGKVYFKDNIVNKLYLVESNANTSLRFQANDVIHGADSKATATIVSLDEYSIDGIRINSDVTIPSAGKVSSNLYFTTLSGGNYRFSTDNELSLSLNSPGIVPVDKWDGYILSRSEEVLNSNLYSNSSLLISNKSFRIDANISVSSSNTNLFFTPTFSQGTIDVYATRFDINANTTALDANNVVIDTEVDGSGSAKARHISTKLKFANNKFAEDLRVYLTAYRPTNTNIQVYARVHNSIDSESFDDKSWTPLVMIENQNRYSSSIDKNDSIEYTFGLPAYSETANALPGSFVAIISNNVLSAVGVTPSTYVANNDMVKLYNPLVPENYMISSVLGANSTAIQLNLAVANNNMTGAGLKVDRLKYPSIAYNNSENANNVRYWTSSLARYDKFDSAQIKIVLVSDSSYMVPHVEYYQVIGVSA